LLDLLTGIIVLFAGPVLMVWWVPNLVHEVGHLLGATISGAHFDFIPLGPFTLPRSRGPRRLRLQIRRFACDSALPTTGHTRPQLFAASLGGPAFNIGLGVALLAVAFLGDIGRSAFLAPLVLVLVGTFCALHGLMYLLPWRPYGVPSDGRRLWSLLAGTPSGGRWKAIKEAVAQSEAGIRPRDLPLDVMTRLVVPSDGSIDDISAALTLYWHLLDSGRLEEARACLEQARAAASQRYMSQLNGQIVLLELAYMEARSGPDPAIAVQNLLRSAFIAKATLLRVVGAINLSYSDLDGADKAAAAALRELGALRPGYALMEADLLTQLIDEAKRRREGGPASGPAPTSIASRVDVSRFAVPDLPLQEPAPPPGLRSARTVVGLVGCVMLSLGVYQSIATFARGPASLVAVPIGIGAVLGVVRVRGSRGAHRVDGLRTAFAAAAVVFAVSPLLASDLLRPTLPGYIWIVGQSRPCPFGSGHDVATVGVYLFAIAVGMVALMMGTRAADERALPRRGIFLGVGVVVLWIAGVAADHAHFAAVIGCGS
jgi:hypothetical protein